ncbi:hypothetical protein FN846DRAFT_909088 [Sphaerosporella brunnea]|uniref:PH domain-like protein n=1 Tax=Sphaerosporella brunnea TaxID=1250544 RepID=A0A5J5ESD2_9PEZI|nr:hypothetical protein FN846DRAFT_909088 [Sphaerosporella brunnea]
MTSQATRESIAHTVLTRYLPTLTRIITTASFCHVYRGAFNTSSDSFSWEKKDISGSLFLAATTHPVYPGEEQYHLVILNRQSVNNFIWTLDSTECIEDDGEQLILSHTSGFSPSPISEPGYTIDEYSCWGIWVFPNPSVEDERAKMLNGVMYYAKRAEECNEAWKQRKNQPAPPAPPPQQAQSGDVEGAPLGGYSILDQIFPQQQQQPLVLPQPSPTQYASPPPPQFQPPYPNPYVQHQDMPANDDILGRLFESARQRSTPQPGAQMGY